MTRHFRVSEADCLEIAGTAHRLIRSDKTGTIWARLDDDNIRLSLTGEELLRLIVSTVTRPRAEAISPIPAMEKSSTCWDRIASSALIWTRSETSCASIFWTTTHSGSAQQSWGRGSRRRECFRCMAPAGKLVFDDRCWKKS